MHLVDGEKDADALIYLGCVATTAPVGAVNFDKCDTAELTGLNVIAIADKCPASRKWQDFGLFKGGDGRAGEAEM